MGRTIIQLSCVAIESNARSAKVRIIGLGSALEHLHQELKAPFVGQEHTLLRIAEQEELKRKQSQEDHQLPQCHVEYTPIDYKIIHYQANQLTADEQRQNGEMMFFTALYWDP